MTNRQKLNFLYEHGNELQKVGIFHQITIYLPSFVTLELCAKFELSSMRRRESRTPHPGNHTWRTLKVLTGVLEEGVIFYIMDHQYAILYLFAKFQLSSMIRSVPGTSTPCPWSNNWRTLKVPDWSLGECGHPWYHGSSEYVIFHLCAKFQLSGMIRSVSRTPHPRSHASRTLKVPHWSLEGWHHPWHNESS